MAEKPKRVFRKASAEERARHEAVRRAEAAARPETEREVREAVDRYDAGVLLRLRKTGVFDLTEVAAALKEAREAQGLTLAQVSAATGIGVPALSALESGRAENPTLRTLRRYAAAVGRRFVVGLVEAPVEVAAAR